MEDIRIDKLSPLAVNELGKHLNRGECEEGTWREFAGYAYDATFQNILEIESKRDSPTGHVLDYLCENKSDMNVGHLVKILTKIGRPRAVDGLCRLFQENRLAASDRKQEVRLAHQSPNHQSILPVAPSCPHPSLPDATLFLSFSGSMVHRMDQFAHCLHNATGYEIELDQRKPSAWINQEETQRQIFKKFRRASFVICFIDREYVMQTQGRSTHQMQTNTRFIVQLMSDEYNKNGINSRFLPYFLDANIPKVFSPYLDNPPPIEYAHYKNILGNELKKIHQLEMEMRAMRITERQHYHNTNTANNVHRQAFQNTAPPVDQSVHPNTENSENPSDEYIMTKMRRNSNKGPDANQNVLTVIKQDGKKPAKLKIHLPKLLSRKNQKKNCKATDTQLIIFKTCR